MKWLLGMVLAPIIAIVVRVLWNLFMRLMTWLAHRSIDVEENELRKAEAPLPTAGLQEMKDCVRNIYGGFYGKYMIRVWYFAVCFLTAFWLIFIGILFFFLFGTSMILALVFLGVVSFFILVFPYCMAYRSVKKGNDSILDGSWSDGKTDAEIREATKSTVNSYNRAVDAIARRKRRAPLFLRRIELSLCCVLVLFFGVCAHIRYGEEPALLRAWHYRYTVTDGEAEITGYRGPWRRLCVPASLGGVPVTAVGDGAFFRQEDLESVRFAGSVKRIGEKAFYDCEALTRVTLPNGLEEIGEYAFEYCRALTQAALPDGLKRVGAGAFQGCGLTQVRFPEGIEELGAGAFACTRLVHAEFPDTPLTLTGNIFDADADVRELEVPPDHPTLAVVEGALYDKASSTLLYVPSSLTDGEYHVPAGTLSIGARVFYDRWQLESVFLPEGLEEIAEDAFSGCGKLARVTLPEGLKVIGGGAFRDCGGLTELTLPEGLEEIGEEAFSRCGKLSRVSLPEGMKVIGRFAFSNCGGLTELTLPEGLEEIGEEAFSRCGKLSRVTLPDSLRVIGSFAFSSCGSLKELVIPPRVASIEDIFGFYGTSLEALTVPPGVTLAVTDDVIYGLAPGARVTVAEGSSADAYFKYCADRVTVVYADFP